MKQTKETIRSDKDVKKIVHSKKMHCQRAVVRLSTLPNDSNMNQDDVRFLAGVCTKECAVRTCSAHTDFKKKVIGVMTQPHLLSSREKSAYH